MFVLDIEFFFQLLTYINVGTALSAQTLGVGLGMAPAGTLSVDKGCFREPKAVKKYFNFPVEIWKELFFSSITNIDDLHYCYLVKSNSNKIFLNENLRDKEEELFSKSNRRMYKDIYWDEGELIPDTWDYLTLYIWPTYAMDELYLKFMDFLDDEKTFKNSGYFGSLWMYEEYRGDLFFHFNKQLILSKWYFHYISGFRERAFRMVNVIFQYQPLGEVGSSPNKAHAGEYTHGVHIVYNYIKYRDFTNNYVLENFTDLQEFAFDKNFFFLWRYWKPWKRVFSIFAQGDLYSPDNHLHNFFLFPMLHYPTKYSFLKSTLVYFRNRELSLSVFPDCVLCWDDSNYLLDSVTTEYTRFYKNGRTFFDFLFFIDRQRYMAAHLEYYGYDWLVGDIHMFKAIYFPGRDSGARFVLQALVTWNHTHAGDFQMFINNYNSVFHFTDNPIAKKYLNAELLLKKSWIDRLKLFRDDPDEPPFFEMQERYLALFFGYNSSLELYYMPKWAASLFSNVDFYIALPQRFIDDQWREAVDPMMFEKLYDFLKSPGLDYSYYIEYKQYKAPPIYIGSLLAHLNERVHNDSGYFYSLLNFTYENFKKTNFSITNFFNVVYTESLSTKNYSWLPFYSLILDTNWIRLEYPIRFLEDIYEEIEYFFRHYHLEQIQTVRHKAVLGYKYHRYSNCYHVTFPVFFTIDLPEAVVYLDKVLDFMTFFITFHINIPPIFEKCLHAILNCLPNIIRFEFMWPQAVLRIWEFRGDNRFISIACLDTATSKISLFPLNFFTLFNTQGNVSPLCINIIEVPNCPMHPSFLYKDLLREYSDEEMMHLVRVWGLSRFTFYDDFLLSPDFLLAMALINNDKYRIDIMGMQRHQDYVLRRTTFHKNKLLR